MYFAEIPINRQAHYKVSNLKIIYGGLTFRKDQK